MIEQDQRKSKNYYLKDIFKEIISPYKNSLFWYKKSTVLSAVRLSLYKKMQPNWFTTLSQRQWFIFDRYDTHARDLPWRQSQSPYETLVAEMMSQQTQLSRIIPKRHQRMTIMPTIQSCAIIDTQTLLGIWIWLWYNSRALRLRDCAKQICDIYDWIVPNDYSRLIQLPWIGDYTASALCAFSYNQDIGVMDTNTIRICRHFFPDTQDRPRKKIKDFLQHIVPVGQSRRWYSALMDYATQHLHQRVNTPQSPFAWSRRQQRSRILKHLQVHKKTRYAELQKVIDSTYDMHQIINQLWLDWFITCDHEYVYLK